MAPKAKDASELLARVFVHAAERRETLESYAQFYQFKKDANAMVMVYEEKLGAATNSVLGDDVDQTKTCIKRMEDLHEAMGTQDTVLNDLKSAGTAVCERNSDHAENVRSLLENVDLARQAATTAISSRKQQLAETLYIHEFNAKADSVESRIREINTHLNTALQVVDVSSAVSETRKYVQFQIGPIHGP